MRANSPSSVFASLTLHGAVVAFILATTMYVAQQDKPPVIFELVAGPPTAPGELVAPAQGNSETKVKLDIPKVELPPDKTEPVKEAAAVETPPPVKETVPVVKPAPTKAKSDMSLTKELKNSQRVSYKDYIKKHPTPKAPIIASTAKAGKVPRIDTEGIADGVRGGSTTNKRGGGGGKALSREEQNALDTYDSFLMNALREAYEPPPGVSDKLAVRVTFDITASGSILNPRIAKSSGDRAFDEAVLEAFRRVRSIGPTPNGKPDTITLTFRMREE